MDLSKLQELKRRLVDEKDFMKVWGYFLDEFATSEAFMDRGEPIRDDELHTTIAHIVLQMFPRDGTITEARLFRLADQQFVHGSLNVRGRFGGMLFFEDINVGLVAISEHFPSDETKFARFSTTPYKPGRKPSRN